MRKLNITLCLAVAAFAVSASACENLPTQSDADVAVVSSTTSNVQSRVTLCHRSNNGEYTEITIADAAYDTHVGHGDRQTNVQGGCPTSETARLELTVDENEDSFGVSVHVGPSLEYLGLCQVDSTCAYDVPFGSNVRLYGPADMFSWEGGTCESSPCDIVMDTDRDVFAEFDDFDPDPL